MSQMDGFKVLNSLLDSPRTSDIPFIFNSCHAEASDKALALELGADDYIIKPFELDALLRTVNMRLASGTTRHLQST